MNTDDYTLPDYSIADFNHDTRASGFVPVMAGCWPAVCLLDGVVVLVMHENDFDCRQPDANDLYGSSPISGDMLSDLMPATRHGQFYVLYPQSPLGGSVWDECEARIAS